MKIYNPKIKEECGVFGISNSADASTLTALGLHALQHRGQEGCGIVSFDGKKYHSEKYLFEDQNIFIKATEENINLLDKNTLPIETASLLVQEDLVLMTPKEDEFYLEAAVLTSPSHWSLVEKFSKTLMDVHQQLPWLVVWLRSY